MPINSLDFEHNSFRIKHDYNDEFFSRLLSKETSKSNPSFRVYCGDMSDGVPFVWETRPGTPKHRTFYDIDASIVPPLTPPPSFYTSNMKKTSKRSSKSRLLQTLLRRISHKKTAGSIHFELASSLYSSSSSSSSPWDVPVSDTMVMPSSVYVGRQESRNRSIPDVDHWRLSLIMKKALASVIGRRSG